MSFCLILAEIRPVCVFVELSKEGKTAPRLTELIVTLVICRSPYCYEDDSRVLIIDINIRLNQCFLTLPSLFKVLELRAADCWFKHADVNNNRGENTAGPVSPTANQLAVRLSP